MLSDRVTTENRAEPDTIVAISTPPGRGGIGIVRLSGPEAMATAARLVALKGPLEHARATFARVRDPGDADATIDEAVVTAFFAPHSYTGDDLVEIAAHGSPVVLEAMVRAALASPTHHDEAVMDGPPGVAGAPTDGLKPVPLKAGEGNAQAVGVVRLAEPGEFTQRAFLSGRLDLTQAEAVHDLIAAQTLDQARVAAQQMGGALSRRVAPAKGELLHLIALLEAGMDFASGELDDVEVVPPAQIAASIDRVTAALEELAATFARGQLLRNGAAIALVGRPNAGKSSLFNRLLERERAIVTALPGTTRDTLEEAVSLGGVPVRLVDTAGLRGDPADPTFRDETAKDGPPSTAPDGTPVDPTHDGETVMSGPPKEEAQGGPSVTVLSSRVGGDDLDEAERMGIARTREALADADLILLVRDATQAVTAEDVALEASIAERPHLVVHNKIDLVPARKQMLGTMPTSAVTGEGLDALREAMLERLGAAGSLAETGLLNNLRQQQAVMAALAALGAAGEANALRLPHEMVLLDLHTALTALDQLTGATTTDDILARIFATFCIGK